MHTQNRGYVTHSFPHYTLHWGRKRIIDVCPDGSSQSDWKQFLYKTRLVGQHKDKWWRNYSQLHDTSLSPSSPSRSDAELGANLELLSNNSFSLLSFFYFYEIVTVYDRLMMTYLLLNIFRYIPDCGIKFHRDGHNTAGGWYPNSLQLPHVNNRRRNWKYKKGKYI